MKLCTECHWNGWDRIVDIYSSAYDSLPEYINDETTYKIIILEKGVLDVKTDLYEGEVKAPALIMLSQKDNICYKTVKSVKADIIFFKPSAIRDEFTYERIESGEFDETVGQVIYQDYFLIRVFLSDENKCVIPLPANALKQIKLLFNSMDNQLKAQRDGFWPCRSRSFLMEILHIIVYSYYLVDPEDEYSEDSDKEQFSKIAEYLELHLGESISLATITKEFAINRNKLNDIFMKQTSMTCLGYLLNLRLDLAKILLTKTELPIGEIGDRVGYPDPNYFTKVFKENVGMTPSRYRKS